MGRYPFTQEYLGIWKALVETLLKGPHMLRGSQKEKDTLTMLITQATPPDDLPGDHPLRPEHEGLRTTLLCGLEAYRSGESFMEYFELLDCRLDCLGRKVRGEESIQKELTFCRDYLSAVSNRMENEAGNYLDRVIGVLRIEAPEAARRDQDDILADLDNYLASSFQDSCDGVLAALRTMEDLLRAQDARFKALKGEIEDLKSVKENLEGLKLQTETRNQQFHELMTNSGVRLRNILGL